jgi:hypothetical protein
VYEQRIPEHAMQIAAKVAHHLPYEDSKLSFQDLVSSSKGKQRAARIFYSMLILM